MSGTEFDLVIVGAGPGGYVGAIRAAQLGLKTALIEEKQLGGICLNWGCIPTKALLRSAEVYQNLQHADTYGLVTGELGFDLKKIVARSRKIAQQLSSGVAHLLKKNKVVVFPGRGKLLGGGKVLVDGDNQQTILSAQHIVLATGARPRVLPGLEPDGTLVWTSKEALIPESLPDSLLVIGSGAIGIEFASFYNTLGVKVTVVEIVDQILPVEDREIAELAQKIMEKQGLRFYTNTKVTKLVKGTDSVTVTVEKEGICEEITVSRVITAVGVVPNVENLGLETAEVSLSGDGFIRIDAAYRTTSDGIYAIGDVAGTPCLAHKASHEAVACVESITGRQAVRQIDKTLIPSCTYCSPQVASIGLTETQAREEGFELKIGRFPFRANGKALALGEPEGLVKTIFNKATGELLGAHLVGSEVTELIQGFSIAKTLESTEAELIQTIFPHPTLSEMMHESVLDAYGMVLHY